MVLRRSYFNILTVAMTFAFFLAGGYLLHKEWRSGYIVTGQSTPQGVNLLAYRFESALERAYRPLVSSRKPGLEQIKLYIPEQGLIALANELPSHIKDWQGAHMVYPNGGLERVRVRYRGDNPDNWAYGKKSWRIKLRKKRMIGGTRVFNYLFSELQNMVPQYAAFTIAKAAGILAPRARLIEFFINDKPQGIYIEAEQLDESFLRKNKIMPVNLYKGEQYNAERLLYVNNNLFDNPALWSKTAVFNQLPKQDHSDLASALDLIRRAETSETAFGKLTRVARVSDWARYAAYQTLIQNWSGNAVHNMRLVSDPWRGAIKPVPTELSVGSEPEQSVVLDRGTHSLTRLYSQSSLFLVAKYRRLKEFIDNRLLSKAAGNLEKLLPKFSASYSREAARIELVYSRYATRAYLSDDNADKYLRSLIESLTVLEKTLKKLLSAPPIGSWRPDNGGLAIVVEGTIPLGDLKFDLKLQSPIPTKLAWDMNGDRRLGPDDLPVPFEIRNSRISIESILLANRLLSNRAAGKRFDEDRFSGALQSVPTVFHLISDVPLTVGRVTAASALTGEGFELTAGLAKGVTPLRTNKPIIEVGRPSIETWPMKVVVDGVRFVDRPTRILAGTEIEMTPNASLIFRQPLMIEGNASAPVKFFQRAPGKPWGVVALHGTETAGSSIAHTIFEGGSGAVIGPVRYVGMVSVHETTDINFDNTTFRDNHKFDDMVHVVYSRNIRFRNCLFEGAFSDALDSDISEIRIENCRFIRSGNDAIDLMATKALISSSVLRGSGDKGVSIGEGSDALVLNSRIDDNQIGLAIKDASSASIVNSEIIDNHKQIAAYRKNWRYGNGGKADIDKSMIAAAKNEISAGKKSHIRIFDSTVQNLIAEKSRRLEIDDASALGVSRQAVDPGFHPDVAQALKRWGVAGHPEMRGVTR